MRTTFNIEDEVLDQVRNYARERTMPTGRAISTLLKKALKEPIGFRRENGFLVFDVPADSPVVTQEHVQRLIDEL